MVKKHDVAIALLGLLMLVLVILSSCGGPSTFPPQPPSTGGSGNSQNALASAVDALLTQFDQTRTLPQGPAPPHGLSP